MLNHRKGLSVPMSYKKHIVRGARFSGVEKISNKHFFCSQFQNNSWRVGERKNCWSYGTKRGVEIAQWAGKVCAFTWHLLLCVFISPLSLNNVHGRAGSRLNVHEQHRVYFRYSTQLAHNEVAQAAKWNIMKWACQHKLHNFFLFTFIFIYN